MKALPSISHVTSAIEKILSPRRFKHTLGVRQTALDLASKHPLLDPVSVELAALLHDLAKEKAPSELLALAERFGLTIDPICKVQPQLLHAPVGAKLAQLDFGLDEPETLQAIISHTLGRPQMSLLEEIIFLADAIEPSRSSEWAGEIRQALSEHGLNKAIARSCQQTILEVLRNKRLLHPLTIETYNYYLQLGDS